MQVESTISNVLLEHCRNLLYLTSVFHDDNCAKFIELDYREKIIMAFDNFKNECIKKQLPAKQVQDSIYALAIFIDELILCSAWPGKEIWRGKTLQLEFFGEHIGGEGFFIRLEKIRQNSMANIDVLEIYYLCLCLGFEGTYRINGIEKLMALQADLYNQIVTSRNIADMRLSHRAISSSNLTSYVYKEIPLWTIASVTAMLILFIYTGFDIVANHHTDHILKQLSETQNLLIEELYETSTS